MLTFRLESLGRELLRHNSLWVASFFASDSNFAQPDFCFFMKRHFSETFKQVMQFFKVIWV